jgi:hypothetical protein
LVRPDIQNTAAGKIRAASSYCGILSKTAATARIAPINAEGLSVSA